MVSAKTILMTSSIIVNTRCVLEPVSECIFFDPNSNLLKSLIAHSGNDLPARSLCIGLANYATGEVGY